MEQKSADWQRSIKEWDQKNHISESIASAFNVVGDSIGRAFNSLVPSAVVTPTPSNPSVNESGYQSGATVSVKPVQVAQNSAVPQNPVAQNPVIQNPVAQNQTIPQNPMSQNPVMQNPMSQNPVMQNPLSQNPVMQNPLSQNPVPNQYTYSYQAAAYMGDSLYPQNPNDPKSHHISVDWSVCWRKQDKSMGGTARRLPYPRRSTQPSRTTRSSLSTPSYKGETRYSTGREDSCSQPSESQSGHWLL